MSNDRSMARVGASGPAAACLLSLAVACASAPADEWLQLRGDRHMSGRTKGVGRMHEAPQEAWRYDIAAWEAYVEVGDRGQAAVELPAAPVDPGYIGARGKDWGIGAALFDLAGDGVEVGIPVGNGRKFGVRSIFLI